MDATKPKARIEGIIQSGFYVWMSNKPGVLTTKHSDASPDFPHAVGKIEHGELKLTPEGEKIIAYFPDPGNPILGHDR